MYKALLSFTTNNYDVRKNQILPNDFTTQDEIQEFLNIGYIEVYDGAIEITENGTYNVEDYETADVNVSSEPTLQEKSITITENTTTNVTPDTGYDGLSKVSVTTNVSGIVPTGTINITSNGTHDVTNYANASVNVQLDLGDYFNSTISSGLSSSKPGFGYVIKKMPDNLTVSGTTLDYTFTNSALESLPALDTSSVTSMQLFVQGNTQLTGFPAYDTSNVTAFSHLCYGCSNLKDFPVLDFSSARYLDGAFTNCNSLTSNSLNNILASLTTATSYTETKTLRSIGLSNDQATICTSLSNWVAVSASGWTTGY